MSILHWELKWWTSDNCKKWKSNYLKNMLFSRPAKRKWFEQPKNSPKLSCFLYFSYMPKIHPYHICNSDAFTIILLSCPFTHTLHKMLNISLFFLLTPCCITYRKTCCLRWSGSNSIWKWIYLQRFHQTKQALMLLQSFSINK